MLLSRATARTHLTPDALTLEQLEGGDVQGFGMLEGPYAQWKITKSVRWMMAQKAVVRVVLSQKSTILRSLRIKVLTKAIPQSLHVLLNGTTIAQQELPTMNVWRIWDIPGCVLQPGENVLQFEAVTALQPNTNGDSRSLYVLFEELSFHEIQ